MAPEHDTPKEQPATRPVRNWILFIYAALGAVILFLFMALIYIYVSIRSSDETSERQAELENRIKELSTQMQAFMEASKESKSHDSHPDKALEQLHAKIDQMEKELAMRQDQIAKIPQSLGLFERLHDKMQSSRPFDKDLQEAMGLFDPEDQDMHARLATLMAYGKTGVPSVEQLKLEFETLVPDLLQLSIPADLSWYERLGMRVKNLVIIRKHGEELGPTSSSEDRIVGIQHLLDMGNIEGALTEAELLPKFSYDPYLEWRNWADKRLFIEQSLPIMEAHALAHMVNGQPKNMSGR